MQSILRVSFIICLLTTGFLTVIAQEDVEPTIVVTEGGFTFVLTPTPMVKRPEYQIIQTIDTNPMSHVAWHPNQNRVAIARQNDVMWFEVDSNNEQVRFNVLDSTSFAGARSIAWHPQEHLLVIGGGTQESGRFAIVDTESNTIISETSTQGIVTHIAWHPNGQQFGTISGNIATIWGFETTVTPILDATLNVNSSWLQWSRDGSRLASIEPLQNAIHIWDMNPLRLERIFGGTPITSSNLNASYDLWGNDNQVVTAIHNGEVWAWELTGQTIIPQDNAISEISHMQWKPDYSGFVSSNQRDIQFTDGRTWETERVATTDHDILDLTWSTEGNLLVALLANNSVMMWIDTQTPVNTEFSELPPATDNPFLTSLELSSDNLWAATIDVENKVWVWNLETGAYQQIELVAPVEKTQWLDDGSELRLQTAEFVLRWDVETAQIIDQESGSLANDDDALSSSENLVAWHPEGVYLATIQPALDGDTILVSNTEVGQLVSTLPTESQIVALRWNTENQLVSLQENGTQIVIWEEIESE